MESTKKSYRIENPRLLHVLFRIFGIILLMGVCYGQDTEKLVENPCRSKLILKAKKEGMRSLKGKEIPYYILDVWNCRKAPEAKNTFSRINQKTNEKDFENSEKLVGFTSTCAYCSAALVIIFYMFKLTD